MSDTDNKQGARRFVDQTTFAPAVGADAGNCMQACVASLLGLSLDDVPHFAAMEGEDEWWWSFIVFATDEGFSIVTMPEPLYDVLGIASGKSPRGEWEHVVLWRGSELVHDPHPSRDGLDGGPKACWYLVPHDPVARVPVEQGETDG